MSDIDTFDHSYVGLFNKLPLYHPVENGKMDYFKVNPQNLVIGGGSGEHPAMLVQNLDACVACFLEIFQDFECYKDKKKNLEKKSEQLDDLVGHYTVQDNLQMGGWDMCTIGEFHETLDESFSNLKNIPKSEKISDYYSDEEKIHKMLGEFLYFSGRSLLSEQLNTFLDEPANLFKEVAFPLFYAVKCDPQGYPTTSGRYFKGNDTKRSWGFNFFDEGKILNQTESPSGPTSKKFKN